MKLQKESHFSATKFYTSNQNLKRVFLLGETQEYQVARRCDINTDVLDLPSQK